MSPPLYSRIRLKLRLIWSDFLSNMKCVEIFSQSTQILNFMKIRPSEAELLHADRYTAPILLPVGSYVGAVYQKLYIQTKSAPENGRVCRPKYVDEIQIDQ